VSRVVLAAGALLAVVAAGCAPTEPQTSTPASGQTAAVPTATAASAAPCRADPPRANAAVATGSALRLTVVHMAGPSGHEDIALPAGLLHEFPELRGGLVPNNLGAVFDRAFAAGAFLYGGADVMLMVESLTGRDIVIYDIRPANTQIVCMPSGLLVRYGAEGGEPPPFQFNLDAASPVAREVVHETGEVLDQPYFTRNSLTVESGQAMTIPLIFELTQQAHAFDIAVSYVADGVKYTQIVQADGRPFRVTPDVCPWGDTWAELPAHVADTLRSWRFEEVRQKSGAGPEGITVESLTPEEFAESCEVW
jgi:hypothetical protein